ncbi:RNA polymerase sigma factor [Dyadobacter subterraneus]|uniref:Sigma-70 family RNA polymerase sigma factor n=1 Tax=Dyadobacter subterraneus TaxID=2773304 RepID=A0ABR9W6M0_9BACT|nr:sigma-70 family RNA polymerase sigma factor [Dyadobacter subterraneus]MBE9461073.1 sigma-70 family RNA polymerase sigma factor [Dyadobacter subterraneus]
MTSTFTHSEDKVLWQAFKQGDEVAFTTLYHRYVHVLYGYGKKLISDEEAVQDMVQELFIDIWQSKSRLADVDSPKFYLFRALRRRIHKSVNGNHHSQRWENIDEGIHPVDFPKEYEIIEEEDFQRQKDELNSWLKSLPVRQYEVLMLRYYQDFSYSEISEILSINEQSVRNLIQRAVLKLRHLTTSIIFAGIFLFF